MKRYAVSKYLDAEVEYFVTKTENAIFDAQTVDNFSWMEELEQKLEMLVDLQEDMSIDRSGTFTVSSWYYPLAVECRDVYREKHNF